MSFQAMTWAIEQIVSSPSARCVLMSIANYANTEWCAWPKQETIAGESVQSVDSVQRRLPELIAAKLVRRIKLKRFGRRTHDFYILAQSPYFEAQLEEIRPLLPSSCDVIDDTDKATADCGSDKNDSPPTVPQEPQSDATAECGDTKTATLPQSADDATATVRQQEPSKEPKEIPPNPPRGAISLSDAGEKRFQEFKASYPDGIVDLGSAEREYAALSEADRGACNAAVLAYAERCRRRREKSMKAHLFIRKRSWEGLLASPQAQAAAPGAYEPGSREGRAILALSKIARYSPVRLSDGRVSFRGEITDQLLAMADLPEDIPRTAYARGTPNFRSWKDLINKAFVGCNLPGLPEIVAPGPYAPSVTGKVYSGSDPPPLVEGTLATEDDMAEMAKG